MSIAAARVVLGAVVLVGVLVWLAGLRLLLRMRSRPRTVQRTGLIRGGNRADCLKAFLRLVLSQQGRVVERSEKGATVEMPGTLSQMALELTDQYGGAGYAATADFGRMDRIYDRIMSFLVVGLAPLVMILLVWVMSRFVIPSEDPAVRGQVIQTVHIFHVLWPPFLVYFLHKGVRAQAERFLDNLPAMLEVDASG